MGIKELEQLEFNEEVGFYLRTIDNIINMQDDVTLSEKAKNAKLVVQYAYTAELLNLTEQAREQNLTFPKELSYFIFDFVSDKVVLSPSEEKRLTQAEKAHTEHQKCQSIIGKMKIGCYVYDSREKNEAQRKQLIDRVERFINSKGFDNDRINPGSYANGILTKKGKIDVNDIKLYLQIALCKSESSVDRMFTNYKLSNSLGFLKKFK
ncbi:hypothetical protein NTE17_004114 [Vibrio fluvialis]|nr:hypothetical protein [Vibrio fluvialis]ELO4019674.1 hypothetical protein [Vibrio fluvialis]